LRRRGIVVLPGEIAAIFYGSSEIGMLTTP